MASGAGRGTKTRYIDFKCPPFWCLNCIYNTFEKYVIATDLQSPLLLLSTPLLWILCISLQPPVKMHIIK